MHDWTLDSISMDWKNARAVLNFKAHSGEKQLVAQGVLKLQISQEKPWGPSVSVNKCTGPIALDKLRQLLWIEMQTGDSIQVEAASFEMPSA